MREDGFRWWVDRVKAALKTVDVVRVDHFRGFAAAWEVPGRDKTAQNGQWVNVPGKELFEALKNAIGDLPFWAEDLGVITPDVEELRDSFGFPGMRILQYGFSGDLENRDLPRNYIENSVAYTGTHDNDTVIGWFEKANEHERDFCLDYLNSDGSEINRDFIRAVWESTSDTAITPMQDLLGLGSKARMNFPSSNSGNWNWQCKDGDLSEDISNYLRELTELHGRI
jgi:4-alpha-glucanotransferase